MKDWKTIGKKLLTPPVWLMAILAVFSAAALVAIFLKGWEESPVAYVTYVLAFYTVTVISIGCITVFPGYFRSIRQRIYDTRWGNRYMTDVVFKTHVSLYRSLIINLLYVAVNVGSGLLYHTSWFYLFAAYYFILAVMRFLLLRYVSHHEIGGDYIAEQKRARLCSILLITVNLVLSGAVLMMVYFNRGFEYRGMLIYVMAMYTFYVTISGIRNLIRYRRYQNPILSMTKVVNMAAALFSMLALETAMLSQFGEPGQEEFRRTMIIVTGAGISAAVVGMSGYMIYRANRAIREHRKKKD